MALEDHDSEEVLQRFEQASRRIAVALVVSAIITTYDVAAAIRENGMTIDQILVDINDLAAKACNNAGI